MRRRTAASLRCSGSSVGQEPEQDRHHQHGDGVDLGHHPPRCRGRGRDDQRRDELGERGTRVAGAEDAHRRALPLLAEPGRRVGDADRERAAGDPDEQAQHEVLPVFGRVGQHPGGDHHREHLQEVHDPPAVAVGQDAQRQPYQRAGEDGGRHQQAELGLVEIELRLDLDADDGEHHPDGEVHRKGERAHRQRGDLFAAELGLLAVVVVTSPLPGSGALRTGVRAIQCLRTEIRLDGRQGDADSRPRAGSPEAWRCGSSRRGGAIRVPYRTTGRSRLCAKPRSSSASISAPGTALLQKYPWP